MQRYKYAVTFAVMAGVLAYVGLARESSLVKLLVLYCAVSPALLSLAYWTRSPGLFFKSRSGVLAPWSYLLYLPYFVLNFLIFHASRLLSREPACNEVSENLYLGRRLSGSEKKLNESLGLKSVLDLTCEFPEPRHMRKVANYLCLPVLDTLAPSLEQLRRGVEWLNEKVVEAPAYVHCASGHGRSAAFIVAFMLAGSRGLTVDEAVAQLALKRPGIKLSDDQIARLRQFSSSTGQASPEVT
jgi:hypothetical protein